VSSPQQPHRVACLTSVGARFLDEDREGPGTDRVLVGGVLFRDRLNGLRSDHALAHGGSETQQGR